MTIGRFVPGLALASLLLAVAGCQSGDSGGGGGSSGGGFLGFGGDKPAPQAQDGKVLASELRAFCPRVTVREPEGAINRYVKGGEGDSAKLSYQASITESTRSCNRSTGMLAMQVAVAGRIVPGPAGAPTTITLPIKVSVVRSDGEVLYSKVQNHQVAFAGNQVQQFLYNDSNVVIPIPADGTVAVFAGFDVPKKKQEEAF